MQPSEVTTGTPGRAMTLLLVTVIALAFIGFFVGLDYGVPHEQIQPVDGPSGRDTIPRDDVLPAMSYSEIRQTPVGPTRQRTATINSLLNVRVIPAEGFVPDPELKRASLALRSERRAYNGAPPIIPHEAGQWSTQSCLICHGSGFELSNRTAKQLPHPYYENCMQCHAPAAPNWLRGEPLAENLFNGVAAPFEGARAWPGAPPVVPHTTWMRENCNACHGPTGWPGMETTHPWRENCLQCHAPSSQLDHRPFSHKPAFLPAPQSIRAPDQANER